MKRPRILVLGALAAVAAVALLAAACGGGDSGSLTPAARLRRLKRQGVQDRARDRHRRPRRQALQPPCHRRDPAREVAARDQGSTCSSRSTESDYVPNLQDACRAELRPRDRGRLLDGRGRRQGREGVPEHELRDHRRRARPAGAPNVQGLLFKEQEAGYLAGYLAALEGEEHDSRPSAASRSRRSTTTSPATRPAPRRPTRTSRR